jgi:ketosteroid isomerase-like protein
MALLLVLSACNQSSVDINAEGEKLMQTSREWSKVAGTDSLEKILSYWAEDAVVLPPGYPPVKGKEAIKNMLMKNAQIPGFKISWEPLSVSVSKSGDMAFLMEQNQITVNDSTGRSIITINKGVTVWRKESDGSWKNIVDTWNAAPSQHW